MPNHVTHRVVMNGTDAVAARAVAERKGMESSP